MGSKSTAIIGGLWYLGDKLIKPPINRLSKHLKYLKLNRTTRPVAITNVGGLVAPERVLRDVCRMIPNPLNGHFPALHAGRA